MNLAQKIDFSKYSTQNVQTSLSIVKSWKKTPKDNQNVRELVYWIYYFVKKYNILISDLLDLKSVINHIQKSSNDLCDVWALQKVKDIISLWDSIEK